MKTIRRAWLFLFSSVFLAILPSPSRGAGASVFNLHSFNIFYNGEIPYSSLVQGADGELYGTTFQGGSTGFGVIYEVATNGTISTLYNFTNGVDGAFPEAGLDLANDGNFYGCTVEGGTNNTGVVFKMTPAGLFTPLYSFSALAANGTNRDGASPAGNLTQARDGNLYGTASAGGAGNSGTLFQISLSGSFHAMYSFSALNGEDDNMDGSDPEAALIQGTDGNLYGTTYAGGTNGFGTLFTYDLSQNQLSTLYVFQNSSDGANPLAALVQGTDGDFYGTASEGGSKDYGTLFRMTSTGAFSPLYSFTDGADGANPAAPLIQGADGKFYGTSAGSQSESGSVFSVTTNKTFNSIYSFTGGDDGANPTAALVLMANGFFFGTTSGGGTNDVGAIFSISPAGAFAPVASFLGGVDGNDPMAPLVEGPNNTFYGTTYDGGNDGKGVIFEVTAGGAFNPIYSFTNGADGGFPYAGLTLGTDGNFYGECITGGSNDSGVLFKMTPQGAFTALHSMKSSTDGYHPMGGLVEGTNGNFYGTANVGGISLPPQYLTPSGTIFEMTPGGQVTNLHTFTNGIDGGNPQSGLTLGSDGNFYGTTTTGGKQPPVFPPATNWLGTIFKITPDGVLTQLYKFTNGADGGVPRSTLVQVANGNFYGTASTGGGKNHYGTIFEITPGGAFTPLYAFTNGIDGAAPVAGLTQGPDGNLYGTASSGGAYGYGTIFDITTNGTFTVLYSFFGTNDGSTPMAALLLGTDGNFYGTASLGGLSDSGTVFELELSPLTAPQFTSIIAGSSTTTLTWSTVPNQLYQLQFSPNLMSNAWSNLGAPTNGAAGSASYSDSTLGTPQRFYRVRTSSQ
ncbi:MAG TPA: choice-of-anchor tandem repeat GloVer-containing protein [Verrucomicrobiae bacterium]|nr:choice-of-anchor tandem repeat GloVer-containing protein [Verrucomicrobiae bacterium]